MNMKHVGVTLQVSPVPPKGNASAPALVCLACVAFTDKKRLHENHLWAKVENGLVPLIGKRFCVRPCVWCVMVVASWVSRFIVRMWR